MHHSVNAGSYLAVFSSDIEGRVSDQPAKGGRAMTVGRKPYLGPAPPCPAPPIPPASGMPPSRVAGPPGARGGGGKAVLGAAAAVSGAAHPAGQWHAAEQVARSPGGFGGGADAADRDGVSEGGGHRRCVPGDRHR